MPTIEELQAMFTEEGEKRAAALVIEARVAEEVERQDAEARILDAAPMRERPPWQKIKTHPSIEHGICAYCESPLRVVGVQTGSGPWRDAYQCTLCEAERAPELAPGRPPSDPTTFVQAPPSQAMRDAIDNLPAHLVRGAEWVTTPLNRRCGGCRRETRHVFLAIGGKRACDYICLWCGVESPRLQ